MVLVDKEIQDRAGTEDLITPYRSESTKYCRYNLRAGWAFAPDSGDELTPDVFANGRRTVNWSIKPSETLMVMTRERVKMPSDLMATYSQLNHLAQQGLLLINASVVEPGYDGHLSCFFVNFSKNTIDITPDQEIAKLCFYTLTNKLTNVQPYKITPETYRCDLARAARGYPLSFLAIGNIENRITGIVSGSVKESIKFGGIIIALLIFWSFIEPFASKYVFERIGITTATSNQDLVKFQKEVLTNKYELDKAKEDLLKTEREVKQNIADSLKQREDTKVSERIKKLEDALAKQNRSKAAQTSP